MTTPQLISPEASLIRRLYPFDPERGEQSLLIAPLDGRTKEEKLSLEEALRRERQRQLELGVMQYGWASVPQDLSTG